MEIFEILSAPTFTMHAVPIPWLLCPYPPWPPWPPEAMALTTPCVSVTRITSSRTHQEEEQEDLHLPATELMPDRGGSLRWGAYIGLTPCIAPSYHHTGHYHTGHYHTGHYHTTPRRSLQRLIIRTGGPGCRTPTNHRDTSQGKVH